MYIPSHFKMVDPEMAYIVIDEYSFATLVSQHDGMPFATHLPILINDDRTYLYGHFALANPQWKDIESQRVLTIFHGPHSYISPSWYETDRAVPTWNYVTVHVYGTVELLTDQQELMSSFREMVQKYEVKDSAYQLNEVEPGYIDGMSKAVQGFRIKIDKVEGKEKLSQNHSFERQKRVVQELEKSGGLNEGEIASRMKMKWKGTEF